MKPYEALRQCVEAMKEVDFADCGKDDARWHKLNAAQQVAEEVLKRPEQEPVAWLKFRSAQSYDGRNDVDFNTWLEECEEGDIGDDKLPAFPVYAAPVAVQQTVAAAPPATPNEIVAFIGPHFDSYMSQGAIMDHRFKLSVHDLLSSFRDWFDLDEVGGQKAVAAVPRITQEQIDYIGEQWDGCEYDAPGMTIDIGQAIRAELAKLNAAPQPAAAPSGDVERECTHEMLCAAMKAAVKHKLIPTHSFEETYLKNWAGMKEVIRAAITATKEGNK